MIREDLVAERIAIESYGEAIAYVGADDPTTRRVLEDILAVEEEHADDLRSLLEKARQGRTRYDRGQDQGPLVRNAIRRRVTSWPRSASIGSGRS